jgi:putative transposase
MAYVKNWLHCVWGTKGKVPFLRSNLKYDILNHIRTNAKAKNIYIDHINGHREHIHCLLSLSQEQSLSKVMQLIKGESSFWINKNALVENKFEWADEYFAVSVSESQLINVRNYIKNQEEHHRTRSWNEEYEDFMKRYGFKDIQG